MDLRRMAVTGTCEAQAIHGEVAFAPTLYLWSYKPRHLCPEVGCSLLYIRQCKEMCLHHPKSCLIIKTHTSYTAANTWHGRIGILQRGLDPSPSKSGTSARESNASPLDSMDSQSD